MVSIGRWWWVVASGLLPLAAFGQVAPAMAPIPRDSLEMVTGPVRTVEDPVNRAQVLMLLRRARRNYALRNAGRAYDLKVSFTVNSGGTTMYDGAWQMEDVFDPKQGFRWTAAGPASYTITRISSKGRLYGEESGSYIPLRVQEARAALFDPIPPGETLNRAAIRTAAASLRGIELTCVLISGSAKASNGSTGRRWDETEECIDPQSGLLRVQSQLPGRYYAYDYSNGVQFAGHTLPGKVTITEGGHTVTQISVDTLTELPEADPHLFAPGQDMEAMGRPIQMAGAQKFWRASGSPATGGASTGAVCVFGVVTPSGQLVEAHSLQPSDPNSEAALEAARGMSFAPIAPGARAQQHFAFVVYSY
jgi:hypothetical protein